MDQKKVSILIPLYNSEKYITETIQSAISQTWNYKEIIIIDDHSTDDSFRIAKDYESDILKVYTNQKKGACAARNMAFELSTGDYIQYLDADDLLSPDKIEKQVALLADKEETLAVCNAYEFFDNVESAVSIDDPLIYSSTQPVQFLINLWGGGITKPHFIAPHSWLTPRSLIVKTGSWNEELLRDQDGEFFARVVLKSYGIIYVPGIKSYYRRSTIRNSISSQRSASSFNSIFKALEVKKKLLFEKEDSANSRTAMATQYKILAIVTYPKYLDLYKKAINKSKELGGSKYVPVLGGKMIELTKKIMGWKLAIRISFFLHQHPQLLKIIHVLERR